MQLLPHLETPDLVVSGALEPLIQMFSDPFVTLLTPARVEI